jgi:succinate dehydrogenase flavin-adding protein (antitoxin of CptAB toxin-antitoxin module)
MSISYNQLRYKARRGMLELDLILAVVLERVYPMLTEAERAVLFDILDYPDPVLMDCLVHRLPLEICLEPSRDAHRVVCQKILAQLETQVSASA